MTSRRDFLIQSAALSLASAASPDPEWRVYGGDPGATRYSPLSQIKPSNVRNLKVAWTHRTGDASERPATTIECTPIVANGVLFLSSPRLKVQALEAATGKPLWEFDPNAGRRSSRAPGVNRGVTYFEDGKDRRVFAALNDRLYSFDARTGELRKTFGDNGIVDLNAAFDRDMTGLSYRSTSPPVVFEDTVIVGGGGGEGPFPAAPGHIRGYDAYTGKRKWIFHTIPFPGEFGYDTWSPDSHKHNGGANNWCGMSIDAKRGWAFISTGSAAFDFWGGDRIGDNLFANCVLALDARTGKRIWHFQTVHHDVWDYDLPAQPALVTVRQRSRTVDAVAQVTKTAMLFLLDRQTGKPLLPIEERPVPHESEMADEKLSKTQPFAVKPLPFSRQELNEDLLTDISPEAHAFALKRFRELEGGVPFPAPSRKGIIFSPGTLGGALWGGCSFDPSLNRVFVNSSELPSILALEDAAPGQPYRFGHKGYQKFVDHEGYPGVKPPWGHITAIDLATGDFAWRKVHGEYPALVARGKKGTGSFQLGGTIATAGGLVFLGATPDQRISALSSSNGDLIWQADLPAGGYATPCTYSAGGKQFVAIACGGGNRQQTPSGDYFVAFSLG